MRTFILSPEAEQDLHQIKVYLLEHAGIDVARLVMRELLAGIRLVAKRPEIGHVRQDLADEAVKFWSVFSYLIIYVPDKKPVEIARVLHGKRNLEDVLN